MQYAAPEEHLKKLTDLVERYETDLIALNVFHNFYSYLPEAENDGIKIIRQLKNRQGAFLLCATTNIDDYLYVSTSEEAIFLGPLKEGINDREVLDYFGFTDNKNFIEKYRDLAEFPVHIPIALNAGLCPICAVASGENHTLGCPVEICPWCGGQLTNCACKFTKSGRKEISRESHIDSFEEKLEKKGRIPFNPGKDLPGFNKLNTKVTSNE